jgi:hypothetical protein
MDDGSLNTCAEYRNGVFQCQATGFASSVDIIGASIGLAMEGRSSNWSPAQVRRQSNVELSGWLRRHAAAFFGATAACFRTSLTVIHLVLCALFAASVAHVGAGPADRLCKFHATCHHASGRAADVGTVHVERNATRHRFRIRFPQTRCRAHIARRSAVVTCLDAGLELLLVHGNLLSNREVVGSYRFPSTLLPHRFALLGTLADKFVQHIALRIAYHAVNVAAVAIDSFAILNAMLGSALFIDFSVGASL